MNRACVSGLFCLFLVLCFGVCAQAGSSFEIVPGVGYLTGYSRMEFGDVPLEEDYQTPQRAPYFPVTARKFPLTSGIATLDAKASLGLFTLEGGVKKNFTNDSGAMRSYDWGKPYYDPDHEDGAGWYITNHTYTGQTTPVWYDLDIESRSRTRLDAMMWNAKASCRVYTYRYDHYDRDWLMGDVTRRKGDFSLSLGLGYERRRFEFKTELIEQWSPSGHNDEYYMTGDGSGTGRYKVDYSIPYVELGLASRTERLTFDMSFGGSTLVHVSDEEFNEIQTPGPLYSDGHLSGTALKFTTHLQYDITPHVFVGLAADYIYLRADGTTHQFAYPSFLVHEGDGGHANILPGYQLSLNEEVKSEESCFMFNVGYRFGTK